MTTTYTITGPTNASWMSRRRYRRLRCRAGALFTGAGSSDRAGATPATVTCVLLSKVALDLRGRRGKRGLRALSPAERGIDGLAGVGVNRRVLGSQRVRAQALGPGPPVQGLGVEDVHLRPLLGLDGGRHRLDHRHLPVGQGVLFDRGVGLHVLEDLAGRLLLGRGALGDGPDLATDRGDDGLALDPGRDARRAVLQALDRVERGNLPRPVDHHGRL